MPAQKRGSSRQDYQTPPEFLAAIERQFGPIGFDLACSVDNMVAPRGFTAEHDALQQDWSKLCLRAGAVAFCNPPFSNIKPWAQACCSVRMLRRHTLLLVPYSGGAGWWARHVMGRAMVFGIPRLTFVGAADPYPKDLALCVYGFRAVGHGYWDWRLEE